LKELIANMWETMYNAQGVGLAAPQVGKAINLFIIDTSAFEDEDCPNLKKCF
jgi:peptide deformylase